MKVYVVLLCLVLLLAVVDSEAKKKESKFASQTDSHSFQPSSECKKPNGNLSSFSYGYLEEQSSTRRDRPARRERSRQVTLCVERTFIDSNIDADLR